MNAKINSCHEPSRNQQLLDLIRCQGIVRSRDAQVLGIPGVYLARLHRRGAIDRIGRGLYTLPDHEYTEHHSLAEVSVRAPNSVVCLLSALRFHGLTTQSPHEVWIAIGRTRRAPKCDYPPLQVHWISNESLLVGVETHRVEGVSVRITSQARTVADCFKFRSVVGSDIAVEALRDFLGRHNNQHTELWEMAKHCRVTTVIRPYLEALSVCSI